MVGPAPDKQIPSRPGWVIGVIAEVTSGRPGIWTQSQTQWIRKAMFTHQGLSVWLMNAIFHGFVDEFGIWRRLAKRSCENGQSLKIENLDETSTEVSCTR
jgi:hypothetical protein